jgi:hypothetical protein
MATKEAEAVDVSQLEVQFQRPNALPKQLRACDARLARVTRLLRELGKAKKAARQRKWVVKTERIAAQIKVAKVRKVALIQLKACLKIQQFVDEHPMCMYPINEWFDQASNCLSEQGHLPELRIKLSKMPWARVRLGYDAFNEDFVVQLKQRIAEEEDVLFPYVKTALTRLCSLGLVAVVDHAIVHL